NSRVCRWPDAPTLIPAAGLPGEPTGELGEDAADGPRVESGPGGDLGVGQALALHPEQLAVRRRAEVEHPPPELLGLLDLAGRDAPRVGHLPDLVRHKGPLAVDGPAVGPDPVDEPVERGADEEVLELGRAFEAAGALADVVEDVD